MTPLRYRDALLRAAPDWAEVERITGGYARGLVRQALRRAWRALSTRLAPRPVEGRRGTR